MAIKPKKGIGGGAQALGASGLAVIVSPIFANMIPDIPEKLWIILLTAIFGGIARIILNFLKHEGYDWLIMCLLLGLFIPGCQFLQKDSALEAMWNASMIYRVDSAFVLHPVKRERGLTIEGPSTDNLTSGRIIIGVTDYDIFLGRFPLDENDGLAIRRIDSLKGGLNSIAGEVSGLTEARVDKQGSFGPMITGQKE